VPLASKSSLSLSQELNHLSSSLQFSFPSAQASESLQLEKKKQQKTSKQNSGQIAGSGLNARELVPSRTAKDKQKARVCPLTP
jgi:hypothetical protein